MSMIIIIIYAIFCLLVAYIGRDTRIGFLGVLIFSIFLTPLAVAIIIVLFQPSKRKKGK